MEPQAPSPVLTWTEFVEYVAVEFDLDRASLTPETRFKEELSFDSVRLLEVALAIEDLGVLLDDRALEHLATLAAAYDAYLNAANPGSAAHSGDTPAK